MQIQCCQAQVQVHVPDQVQVRSQVCSRSCLVGPRTKDKYLDLGYILNLVCQPPPRQLYLGHKSLQKINAYDLGNQDDIQDNIQDNIQDDIEDEIQGTSEGTSNTKQDMEGYLMSSSGQVQVRLRSGPGLVQVTAQI